MFKNKHVIIALLVAPMLAIMAWFAVDHFVAEQPQAANPGDSYPLVAKPNCRRPSDGCELTNADLSVTISVSGFDASGADVEVTSVFPLGGAAIGFANGDSDEGSPSLLILGDAHGYEWRGRVGGRIDAGTTMRVLVYANEAAFYGEVPVTFFFTQ